MARTAPDLALYHYSTCPFCARVRFALTRLGVEIELRNIHEDPKHLEDLVHARGRQTVPVLRIRRPEGDEWLPESRDIVQYLERRFG